MGEAAPLTRSPPSPPVASLIIAVTPPTSKDLLRSLTLWIWPSIASLAVFTRTLAITPPTGPRAAVVATRDHDRGNLNAPDPTTCTP